MATNWLIGRKPVIEAIDQGISIEKIWVQQGFTGPLEVKIRTYCRQSDIPYSVVPKTKLNRMSNANHQGVIAYISPIAYWTWSEWLQDVIEDSTSIPLLLDGISDVRNVGAISRSAEIFGARHLIVPTKNAAPINDESMKTSAGAIRTLRFTRVKSLIRSVEDLQMNDFHILVTTLDGGIPLPEMDIQKDGRYAVIIGSEEKGVRPHLVRSADQKIIIPQFGSLDSLNVSVATGIILYELRRRLEAL